MGMTLNLVDHLLTTGRHLQELGRTQDALHLLGRLANFRELPAAVGEEAHARLAEMEMRRRKYHRARRHLSAALVHQPENARYHYLMAVALDDDEKKGDPERAAEHYRKSLELDPNQSQCHADFGLLALGLGETGEALAAFRRAAELAPDDPDVLATVVEGLCQAEQTDEARQLLKAARFRNPRDGRFGKLWSDFQFHQIRDAQEAARQANRERDADEDRPMVLPFRPDCDRPRTLGGKRIRRDSAAPLPAPHVPLPARLPDQRHA